MTLIPSVNRVLDTGNAIGSRIFNDAKIPYQNKFDINFDFDISDLISTSNIIVDENGSENKQNIDVRLGQGRTNIIYWIAKTLNTEKNVYPIYDDIYGFELFSVIGKNVPNEAIEIMLPEFIDDALTYHPNILRVENIISNYDNGNLFVTFDVILDDQNILRESFSWIIN